MKYLQVNEDNIITDCVSYEVDGYMPYDGEITTPVHGGWHKLIDGEIVEQVELNPTTIDNQIKTAIDDYTMSLIKGGIL